MCPGSLTVFALALIRQYLIDGDAEDIFVGVFQVIGAILLTHMGVSVMQQGSSTVRSMRYFQVHKIIQTTTIVRVCSK